MRANDCVREAKPAIWIFSGRSVVLLVIGVLAAVSLFRVLSALDVDWWLGVPVSLVPLLLITGAVWATRDKPTEWLGDLILLWIWKGKTWAFMHGWKENPPLLWIEGVEPNHPTNASKHS